MLQKAGISDGMGLNVVVHINRNTEEIENSHRVKIERLIFFDQVWMPHIIFKELFELGK